MAKLVSLELSSTAVAWLGVGAVAEHWKLKLVAAGPTGLLFGIGAAHQQVVGAGLTRFASSQYPLGASVVLDRVWSFLPRL